MPNDNPSGIRHYAQIAMDLAGRWYKWVRLRFLAPVGATEVGWLHPFVILVAILLTALLYLPWNLYCLREIDHAYDTAVIAELEGIESTSLAVKIVREDLNAEKNLQNEGLSEAFAPAVPPKPLHKQLEIYLDFAVAGSSEPEAKRSRDQLIRNRLTGDRTGFVFWVMGSKNCSGTELVKALKKNDRAWAKKVEARKDAKEYEKFAAKLADRLSSQVGPKIRSLERLNGFVQWLTIFLAWFIVVLCIRRFLWLRSSRGMATTVDRELTDAKVYGSLSFLLGALPALGFIGTVIGMGEALLRADSLFADADKQQAIGKITKELGFAFDTTLVALVASLPAGLVVIALRSFEMGRRPRAVVHHHDAEGVKKESVDGVRRK